jgi:hypothetical protein
VSLGGGTYIDKWRRNLAKCRNFPLTLGHALNWRQISIFIQSHLHLNFKKLIFGRKRNGKLGIAVPLPDFNKILFMSVPSTEV